MRTEHNTTKLISINNNTGEVTGYSNKGVIAKEFNVPVPTVVNWFRDGVKKVIKEFNGCSYTIYRLDMFIYK